MEQRIQIMLNEFIKLYEAVTNQDADVRVRTAVASMVQLSGCEPDQFPDYLLTIARSLANRQTLT